MARKKRSARTKTLTQQQRLRRQDKSVSRIEFALSINNDRDRQIAVYLEGLPEGLSISEFMRQAAMEQIARRMGIQGSADADQLESLLRIIDQLREDNAALRDLLEILLDKVDALEHREVTVEMAQAMRVTVGGEKAQATVESSGIDMRRPRKKLARGAVANQEPDELSETEKIELARQMARSVREAVPGRGR